jgi:hypothetical protein
MITIELSPIPGCLCRSCDRHEESKSIERSEAWISRALLCRNVSALLHSDASSGIGNRLFSPLIARFDRACAKREGKSSPSLLSVSSRSHLSKCTVLASDRVAQECAVMNVNDIA